MKSQFKTHLEGRYLDDGRYVLSEDLVYFSELLNKDIIVPKGFETDFASVPRVPIAYWLFGGKAHHESVVHDYLYRTNPHICTRRQADNVFKEAMTSRKKGFFVKGSMWLGVRLGGKSSWK